MSTIFISLPRVGGGIRRVAALCGSIEMRTYHSRLSEHCSMVAELRSLVRWPTATDQPPPQLRPNGWRLAHAAYR
jgi:hypothetical protein